MARLSLVFETFDGMEAMLEHMLSDDMFGGNVVRVENRYFNPTVLGWRDLQVLVRVPMERRSDAGGAVHHICEIQLQHALLADARRAAHKHYDTIRTRLAVSMPIQEHDNAQAYVLGRLSSSESDKESAGVPTLADVLFYCVR